MQHSQAHTSWNDVKQFATKTNRTKWFVQLPIIPFSLLNVAAAAVPPQFVERLVTKEAREGDSVHFQVRVTGNPAPEVTWYREDAAIVSSPDFEIQQVCEIT